MTKDKVQCQICKDWFKQLTGTHLKNKHGITFEEYKEMFPDAETHPQWLRDRLVDANIEKWSDQDYKDRTAKTISDKNKIVMNDPEMTKKLEEGSARRWSREPTIEYLQKMKEMGERQSGENNPLYNSEIDVWLENNRGKHFCACGCGEKIIIKRFHYHSGIPKYKYNHYGRTESAKEKSRQSAIKQLSENPIFFDTKIELKMQEILTKHGYKYVMHQPCCNVCLPDLMIPDKKIAIFCDGDYWHNYPDGNGKDKYQDKVLLENGWIPLRLWEHEINNNIEDCLYRFELEYHGGEC